MVDNSNLVLFNLLILKDSRGTLLALDRVFHFVKLILSALNTIFYSLIKIKKSHSTRQLQHFFSASIESITRCRLVTRLVC